MPLCERRKQSISIRVAQIRGTWRKSVRVDSSEGHLNVREKALAATLPPINAFFLPWVWRMGLPALWCTIVHVISTYCHNIGHAVRVTWNKQKQMGQIYVVDRDCIFVHIATVDVKAMGVWFIDQTPVQAAHRTACNIVIVFSIEDLGFGTYFVILL